MLLLSVHVTLAITLFLILNWIGKHSYSIGYVEISVFQKSEEAPAFNFIIRVLSPIVFIILASACFYALRFDHLVSNIYLVNLYYIAFRLVFNYITGRTLLINWKKQITYWLSIGIGSIFVYNTILKNKKLLLPDINNLANELWIIIFIFLYQVLNKMEFSGEGQERRRNRYLKKMFDIFKSKYGKYISTNANNKTIEKITYAILIYENFNRPKVIRKIEDFKLWLTGKAHTVGVMQVKSIKVLTDAESIVIGVNKLNAAYNTATENSIPNCSNEYSIIRTTISNFNGGDSYYAAVTNIIEFLENECLCDSTTIPGPQNPANIT